MNDQQSMLHRARAYARVSRLTNPAWITANQQGFLTLEQIGMLAKEVYSMAAYYLMVRYVAMYVAKLCLLLAAGITVLFLLAILQLAGSFIAPLATLSQFLIAPLATLSQFLIAPLATLFQFLGDLPFLLLALLVLVGLCWIPFRVMTARLRNRFKRNVATGDLLLSLAREQGEVVWGNRDYIARTQEHVLTVPRGTGSLIPGPYHFYSVKNWVKNGYIIVSAQPIHTETQMLALPGTLAATGLPGDEQARLAIQLALSATLGFSLLDLEANRLGYLTHEQIRRLPHRVAQKRPFTVQSVEGEINKPAFTNDDGVTIYYYKMGELSFNVPAKAQTALVDGIRYRVYYLAGRNIFQRILLSVEPLEAPRR